MQQAVGGDVLEELEDMVKRGVSPDEVTLLGMRTMIVVCWFVGRAQNRGEGGGEFMGEYV